MKKERCKLYILYTLNILLCILPIILTIAFNFKSYVSTPERTLSLSLSGMLAITVIILNVLNKLPKNVSSIAKLAIVTAFLWLLKPIINELCLLCTMLLCGNLSSMLIFSKAIKKQKGICEGLDKREIEREIIEIEGRV